MAVWLRARRDFTFKGTPYRSGDVFSAQPIDAVQMQVLRAVSFAKAPPPEPAPVPTRRKRTYITKQIVAEPVTPEPMPDPVSAGDDQNSDLDDD